MNVVNDVNVVLESNVFDVVLDGNVVDVVNDVVGVVDVSVS